MFWEARLTLLFCVVLALCSDLKLCSGSLRKSKIAKFSLGGSLGYDER